MVFAMLKAMLISVGVVMTAILTMAFEPPGPAARLKAIAPSDALPVLLKRAVTPDDDFAAIPLPGPQDWLSVHRESGQTFDEFRRAQPNRPSEKRRILYLQPLDEFTQGPSGETLRRYAASFFQMQVKMLPPVNISPREFASRTNEKIQGRFLPLAD